MTSPPDTPDIAALIAGLRRGEHAGHDETRRLVEGVLAGDVDLPAFGEWLVALGTLGESAAEIAGVAAALRGRMLPVPSRHELVADTCGTGGDGSGSFNISTAAALVASAAGLPVAKHGNRAVTSRTGSADVLEALGVGVGLAPEACSRLLDETGFCFCLAPVHHPAMARVGPLRRSLGRPTVFNLVGPLCNPAAAGVQVIGVGRPDVREHVAQAAAALGARRTVVVSGRVDGAPTTAFDEVSLFGPTDVIDVSAGRPIHALWIPEDFGIATQSARRLRDLAVDGPAASAAAIRDVLSGTHGVARDVVVINAAAVLWAAGRAESLSAARASAEAAIDSGRAARQLARLRERSGLPPAT